MSGGGSPFLNLPPSSCDLYDRATLALSRRDFSRALDLLTKLDQQHPGRPEILEQLVNTWQGIGDPVPLLRVCQRLVGLVPNDPIAHYNLAATYIQNQCVLLAWQTFRQFLERWPQGPRAAKVRTAVESLMPVVVNIVKDTQEQFPPDRRPTSEEATKLALLHEEMTTLMTVGRFGKARQKGEELLRCDPSSPRNYNNLTLVCFFMGDYSQAIAYARQALQRDPDNVHALSNLARCLVRHDQREEAKEVGRRLEEVPAIGDAPWVKKLEGFAWLGDDAAIQRTLEICEAIPGSVKDREAPLFHHIAAVSAARLGDHAEADRRWKRCLRLDPHYELALGNQADLAKPVEKRHAPWFFPFNLWIARTTIDEMVAATGQGKSQNLAAFLSQHPEIEGTIPLLFDRADDKGREFASIVANEARTPNCLAALRDFALSNRGPDAMRMQALATVMEAGFVAREPQILWMKGEWHRGQQIGITVGDPEQPDHSPEVTELIDRGIALIRSGNGIEAERLFLQALKAAPGAVDILNNMAMAYEVQGHRDKALALIQKIHKENPDYLFARTWLARIATREGRLDDALELLKPLLNRTRMTHAEMTSVCMMFIDLRLAQNMIEDATHWFGMWKQSVPGHPEQGRYEMLLGSHRHGRPRK